MSISTTPTSATDNQIVIASPLPKNELSQIGHLSRVNNEKFQEVDVKGQRAEEYVSMLHANMDSKLELVWPLSDVLSPRISKKAQNPTANPLSTGSSGEARKARASGDAIDSDGPENSSVVENDGPEAVSGGRRVDPTFGLGEEA